MRISKLHLFLIGLVLLAAFSVYGVLQNVPAEIVIDTGNLTEATSNVLTITGGTNSVVGDGTSIQVKQSSSSQSGYLSSTDWTTFNGKITKSGDTGIGSLALATEKTLGFGVFTTAQETTLTGTLGSADAGKVWYNSTSSKLRYWTGTAPSDMTGTINFTDLAGTATDAQIPNTITLDNLTQITTRSHTSLSDIGTNTHATIDSHLSNTTNPHSVTKTQVGLANVTNNAQTYYTANQYGVVLSGSGNEMSVLAPDASTTKVLTSGGTAANPSWATPSSSNLSEGTNLFYTDERVDDRASVLIQNGTGLSWTYVDASNTLTGNITTVPIANGGTGATTATASFDALSPMTTLGDSIYGGTSGTRTRLAGNTTSTKNFLTQTGNGTVSAAPSWGTIAAGDVPTLNQNTTGTAAALTTNPTDCGANAYATSIAANGDLTCASITNAATTATAANTASTIVLRDGSNNFAAGTITASLTGAASLNVLKTGDTMTGSIASNQFAVADNSEAIDFSLGNVAIINPDAEALTLTNMVDGGAYTIIVKNTTSRTYTIDTTACATAYYQPANAATTNRSVYTILRVDIGGVKTCFISWITEFN